MSNELSAIWLPSWRIRVSGAALLFFRPPDAPPTAGRQAPADCPSGQWERTVNPSAYAYPGSNPGSATLREAPTPVGASRAYDAGPAASRAYDADPPRAIRRRGCSERGQPVVGPPGVGAVAEGDDLVELRPGPGPGGRPVGRD